VRQLPVSGGEVYASAGTYAVSRCLRIPAGVQLVGDGMFATTIRAAPRGKWQTPEPSRWFAIVASVNNDHVGVSNLGVDGRGQVASGIAMLGGSYVSIKDTYVRGGAGHSGRFWPSSGLQKVWAMAR
jgi:Pectate lyase superfamily protein